jgi:benzylsuccinate CoA-transferase BbsF subunit
MNMMQAAGVAAGVVKNAEDQVQDPQLKQRHFFWELKDPKIGQYFSPSRLRFLLSKTPYEVRRAPCLGEHNDHVFGELLGLSDNDEADLVKEKVIW